MFFCLFCRPKSLPTKYLRHFAPARSKICQALNEKNRGRECRSSSSLLSPPNPQALALGDVGIQAYRDGLTVYHRSRGDVAAA